MIRTVCIHNVRKHKKYNKYEKYERDYIKL